LVENCQIKAAMTTRTIQNKRLLSVEFMLLLLLAPEFQDYHA
jgi:hypothetical protein